jgi:hypothetical protein
VQPYLHGFGAFGRKPNVREGDAVLLARLIADARVHDFFGIYDAIRALGPQAAALREPMVGRVLAARFPEAADVRADLEARLEAEVVPRRVLDDRMWQLTLARLSKPVETFVKPRSLSGTQETFEAHLRTRLARFSPTTAADRTS